ncbi:Interferon-induced very large GTPase 1 [Chelonia mydas]|uniref:Interferon-induced very large GTPase 1 n=1 Tax=Chelonia mydas TaxID=8469 RepID=M7AMI0_CHEMY|nr:Interferon-induced very large GTPase 1 [Chelonia mydas]
MASPLMTEQGLFLVARRMEGSVIMQNMPKNQNCPVFPEDGPENREGPVFPEDGPETQKVQCPLRKEMLQFTKVFILYHLSAERPKALQYIESELEMEKYISRKLKLRDILEITPENLKNWTPQTTGDLPWHFLRKLMALNGMESATKYYFIFNNQAGKAKETLEFLKNGRELSAQELGCDFILVTDTEGLKAPELARLEDSYQHDNELATLVIGLSDIAIVNMAMENTTEMKDVLQIVVHAFLRMEEIGQKPNCQFVHQNICDMSAHEQNMRDRDHVLEQLDEMTKAAAKMEKKGLEIKFSDIHSSLNGESNCKLNNEKLEEEFDKMWTETLSELSVLPLQRRNIDKDMELHLRRDLVNRGSAVMQRLKDVKSLSTYKTEHFKMEKKYLQRNLLKSLKPPLSTVKDFFTQECWHKTEALVKSIIDECNSYPERKVNGKADYDETYCRELLRMIDEQLQQANVQNLLTSACFAIDLKLHILGDAARAFQTMHEEFIKENYFQAASGETEPSVSLHVQSSVLREG